jgi:hypothetical protein
MMKKAAAVMTVTPVKIAKNGLIYPSVYIISEKVICLGLPQDIKLAGLGLDQVANPIDRFTCPSSPFVYRSFTRLATVAGLVDDLAD